MENALIPYSDESGEPDGPELQFTPDLVKYRRWFDAYETNKADEITEQQTFSIITPSNGRRRRRPSYANAVKRRSSITASRARSISWLVSSSA